MLLAGGQGSRLRLLTKNLAKPAVPFGGQYRIIDFTLSNCVNSGIDTVGVLTQYKPQLLNSYIGIGSPWDLVSNKGGVTILPPYVGEKGGQWYKGTAHAVYQNLAFIDEHSPRNVLILSGDHIYKMDYSQLLDYHTKKNADVTIAAIRVPWDEASRFGTLNIKETGEITEFEEKPPQPKSNLASMGVYVFKMETLKNYLLKDAEDPSSENDFGKNVLPRILREKQKMYAYPFQGYWKDVGTIESYWLASMDILADSADLDLFDDQWGIYSQNPVHPPHFTAPGARVKGSLISEGCLVFGEVEHSIIFPGVYIGKGTKVKDSVVMCNVRIEENVRIEKAIIGENTLVGEGSIIGGDYCQEEDSTRGSATTDPKITVVEDNLKLAANTRIGVLLKMKRPENKVSDIAGVQG